MAEIVMGAQKGVRETKALMAQLKIATTTPDVEQPLRGAQEKGLAVPRRADEIGNEQVHSANVALTMQHRGMEQTIPLRLSNEDLGKLALEAEFREISFGQLVGMLIEAATAQELSRVLEIRSRAEESDPKDKGWATPMERKRGSVRL